MRQNPQRMGLVAWFLSLLLLVAMVPGARAQGTPPVTCTEELQLQNVALLAVGLENSVIVLQEGAFQVTEASELKNIEGASVPLGNFTPGMRVKAKLCLFSPQPPLPQPGAPPPIRGRVLRMEQLGENQPVTVVREGPIAVLGPNTAPAVTVGGTVFRVASQTVISGPNGASMTYGDLRVGFGVRVEGIETVLVGTTTRALVARKIEVREIPQGEKIVREGPITELGPNTNPVVRVGDTPFRVTSSTEIERANGERATYADLRVGMPVYVEGVRAPSTTNALLPVATKIKIRIVPPPAETVTAFGIIDDLNTATGCFELKDERLVLAVHRDVCTSNETIVRRDTGELLTVGDLREGQRATVRGTVVRADDSSAAGASILAAEIIIHSPIATNRIVVTGRLNEKDVPTTGTLGNVIRVEGRLIAVVDSTLIQDRAGVAIRYAALAVGDTLRVEARVDSSSSIPVAEKIAVISTQPVPIRVEVNGLVESVDATQSQFVVKGLLIVTGEATKFFLANGTEGSFADVTEGKLVSVVGVYGDSRTTINAQAVRIREQITPPNREIEFKGSISEVIAEAKSLRVAGHLVITDNETEILGRDGQALAFASLRVGMLVEVKGLLIPTAVGSALAPFPTVDASRIKVQGEGCIEVEAEGPLTAKTDGIWSVGERRFAIASTTRFASASGAELTANDFAVGDNVKVRACAAANALPVAVLVVKRVNTPPTPECRPTIGFAGVVSEVNLTTNSLVIGNRMVLVTSDTKIEKEEGGDATLAAITVGDFANVRAQGSPIDTTVTACSIRIRATVPPPPSVENRVIGKIGTIDAANRMIAVRDRRILVTDNTEIEGRRGQDLSFQNLVVGMLVDVRGRVDAEGTLVAAKIKVQEENLDPRPVRPIAGIIRSLDLPTSMTVRNVGIILNNATAVEGLNGERLTVNDLVAGDAVVVFPDPEAVTPAVMPPTFVAKRVKITAAILEAIDLEASTIDVGGRTISVTPNTRIVSRDERTTLTLSSLVVGDLLRVRLSPLAIEPPQATLIIRVAVPDFSGQIDNMGEAEHGTENNRPILGSDDPRNTFGFISLPLNMAFAEANTLYELLMTVSTNITDPTRIPTLRVRVNMANFEKGATVIATSAGRFKVMPTTEGRTYSLLFVPPAELANADDPSVRFFASMDLLSFEDRLARGARFRLDDLRINPIADSRISVANTLVTNDFSTGTEGWVFGGAPETFTLPRNGSEAGRLNLAPADARSFGFWTTNTGVTAEPGKIYRARFILHTNTDTPAKVPTVRVRLNTSSYELGATVNVDAVGTLAETLRPESRVYDIYLPIPAGAAADDKILASIDMLNFGNDAAVDSVVSLEQFLLEEITIAAE